MELRVDANGAVSYEEARNGFTRIGGFRNSFDWTTDKEVRSPKSEVRREFRKNQRIAVFLGMKWRNWCTETPTPIALDEELISVIDFEEKRNF